MKKECEIIQDLLFCYYDKTASISSKELVENHLKTCENCKQVLEEIKKDSIKQDNEEEIDYLKKINKKMKKKTIITRTSVTILAIFLIMNFYILFSFYQEGAYVHIYLKDQISSEQLENIQQLLVGKCGADNVEYFSKENALNQVKETFKDKKALLGTYSIDNPFKSSLSVKTKEKDKGKIIQMVENLEGINHITTNTADNPYLWFIAKILGNI